MIDELEKKLLDNNSFYFLQNNAERLAAATALENEGLQGLGVIGTYITLRSLGVREDHEDVLQKLDEVWRKGRARHNIPNNTDLNEAFVRKFVTDVSQEVLGRVPGSDEVFEEQHYKHIVGVMQGILFPMMIMGRFDHWGLLKNDAKERTVEYLVRSATGLAKSLYKT